MLLQFNNVTQPQNDYNSYLHNKLSGEAVCLAMLSITALLHGSINSNLHLVLLAR